jgi:hypothetical protein
MAPRRMRSDDVSRCLERLRWDQRVSRVGGNVARISREPQSTTPRRPLTRTGTALALGRRARTSRARAQIHAGEVVRSGEGNRLQP